MTAHAEGGEFPGGYSQWIAVNPHGSAAQYVQEWGGDVVSTVEGTVVPLRSRAAWPPPIPLDTAARPTFPVQVLPPLMRELVQSVAAATQTPPDLAATFALSSVSTLIGGRLWVSPWDGYVEPTNLWLLSVMGPANRKSSVLREITGPLREIEREAAERARAGIAEAETQRDIADKRAKRAADDAAKASSTDRVDAEAEAISYRQVADALSVPPEPRLLAGDVTPEKVAVLLAEQGGRLGLLSAEGGLFGTLAGRYSNGQANLDVFLQAWSGDAVTVDRMGRTRLYVPRPALTLCLAVQPDILRQVASSPEMRGRGLLGRFLYVLPASLVGMRTLQGDPIPDSIRSRWAALLQSLTSLPVPDEADTPTLLFTSDALQLFADFAAHIEPRLHGETGDLAAIADWAGKLVGTAARIAAVLHMAHGGPDAADQPIETSSVRGAVEIANYAIPHALAAFGAMGVRRDLGPAEALLRWVKRCNRDSFAVRDAWQALKGQTAFPDTDTVRAALRVLTDYEWVREADSTSRGSSGRPPSPLYLVNPALQASHNARNPHIPSSGGSGDCGTGPALEVRQ